MSIALVPPEHHILIRRLLSKPKYVEFYVEASEPISTYILDSKELDVFYAGEDISSLGLGGFQKRKVHHQKLWLWINGKYYFLIVNESMQDVGIFWEFP